MNSVAEVRALQRPEISRRVSETEMSQIPIGWLMKIEGLETSPLSQEVS